MKHPHISGLFETHINVTDLERSMQFYEEVLGLEKANYRDERRICFFWIGERNKHMLGLWEKPEDEVFAQHFAFQCSAEWILYESVSHLKSKGLQPYNFLNDGIERPMVFAWMPVIAIYFRDPDGHSLEYISPLEGQANRDLGVISYQDWIRFQEDC